jgi:hypothetical protein
MVVGCGLHIQIVLRVSLLREVLLLVVLIMILVIVALLLLPQLTRVIRRVVRVVLTRDMPVCHYFHLVVQEAVTVLTGFGEFV